MHYERKKKPNCQLPNESRKNNNVTLISLLFTCSDNVKSGSSIKDRSLLGKF